MYRFRRLIGTGSLRGSAPACARALGPPSLSARAPGPRLGAGAGAGGVTGEAGGGVAWPSLGLGAQLRVIRVQPMTGAKPFRFTLKGHKCYMQIGNQRFVTCVVRKETSSC